MNWEPPVTSLTPLVSAFRNDQGPGNLLGLECFLLCSQKPRTIAELMELTGAPNARINLALRQLTPYWDARAGVVKRPAMHLLQRRRVINGQGHRYFITSKGRRLLKGESSTPAQGLV